MDKKTLDHPFHHRHHVQPHSPDRCEIIDDSEALLEICQAIEQAAQIGDRDRAILLAESCCRRPGIDAATYRKMSHSLMKLTPCNAIESFLSTGIKNYPNDCVLTALYAEHAMKVGDFNLALARWKIAEDVFVNDPRPWVEQCSLLRDMQRFDDADAVITKARALFPTDLVAALGWGLVAHVRGDYPEALARWMKIVTEFPDSLGALCRLSMVYCDLGRHDESDATLKHASQLFPDHRDILFQQAANATSAADWKNAAKYWHCLHERFPDDPVILNQMNRVIVEISNRIGDTDTSEELLRPHMGHRVISSQSPRDIVSNYESLGGDCEFGLVQRHFGCEPLDLFRWAGITEIERLTDVLDQNLARLVDPDAMNIELAGNESDKGEYIMVFKRLSLVMHSWIFSGDNQSAEVLQVQFKKRIEFLRRNFLESAALGEKIYIFKDRHHVERSLIHRLYKRLNEFGENKLIVVQLGDQHKQNAQLELIEPGLCIGYLNRFGHPNTENNQTWNIDFDGWLEILTNATLSAFFGDYD